MLGLRLKHFKFWCQSVLPLVYDESLSYYEVLCKVVDYINKLIDSDKEIIENIDELKNELQVVENWIKNFDYDNIEKIIKEVVDEYIVAGVYFEINQDGFFVAYIPESWDEITFNTTEYDIVIPIQPEFGHLVLSY